VNSLEPVGNLIMMLVRVAPDTFALGVGRGGITCARSVRPIAAPQLRRTLSAVVGMNLEHLAMYFTESRWSCWVICHPQWSRRLSSFVRQMCCMVSHTGLLAWALGCCMLASGCGQLHKLPPAEAQRQTVDLLPLVVNSSCFVHRRESVTRVLLAALQQLVPGYGLDEDCLDSLVGGDRFPNKVYERSGRS